MNINISFGRFSCIKRCNQYTFRVLFALFLTFIGSAWSYSQVITTIAGGSNIGDGYSATNSNLKTPAAVAVDLVGNIYIADQNNFVIRKVNTLGIISTIAGNGFGNYTGDGGQATDAGIGFSSGITVDGAGNIFIADQGYHIVRKINPSGIINTVAGNGTGAGFSGDGGAATSATLNQPQGIAVDAVGNMFIADMGNSRIRKIDTTGIITTIAGTGINGYNGDAISATLAKLNEPMSVAIDATGNILVADYLNSRIRKINSFGIISTIAGTGSFGFSGDAGNATAAQLGWPNGISVNSAGNIVITDYGNYRIRKVNSSGLISTVAGNGSIGFSGDGSAATLAKLNGSANVAIDGSGNVFVCDVGNQRIRKINSTGTISTIAGGSVGDNGNATNAELFQPDGITIDGSGAILIADCMNNRIRKVNSAGIISTIAGNGISGFSGDGGAATAAQLNMPKGISLDTSGNIFIADYANHCIRKVNSSGIITTIAGVGGASGFSGDGGLATAAHLSFPWGVATDGVGTIFVSDGNNNRVRKINTFGIISTIAGSATGGYSGEGIATASELYSPAGLAFDGSNNLLVADWNNHRIRKVTAGIISTLAGNGTGGYSGDGVAATNASLFDPYGVTFDQFGNFYIADNSNSRIRKVNSSGIISTIAGNGTFGFSGDGGSATDATLRQPSSVKVDNCGNIFIADEQNNRIRKVTTLGVIGGGDAICIGNSMTMTDTTFGGTWSASNSHATISSIGLVTGISSGDVTISYSRTNACGTDIATKLIHIDTIANAGTVFVSSLSICPTNSVGLYDSVPGGMWNFSGAGIIIHLLSDTSSLTVLSSGIDTVTYSVSNSCGTSIATSVLTINLLPDAGVIYGSNSLCTESTIDLTETVTGGTWSTVVGVASMVGDGIVWGAAGSPTEDTVQYTVFNSCGTATSSFPITVNPMAYAGHITGADSVCIGSAVTLSEEYYADGGYWYSVLGFSDVSDGVVTGYTAGVDTIRYLASNEWCSNYTSKPITINPLPDSGVISGADNVCVGASITMSETVSGGVWNMALGLASVTTGGIIHGISVGVDTIRYTVTNSCGNAITFKIISVSPPPNAGVVTGSNSVCTGINITLTDTISGGTWLTSNSNASLIGAGVVQGVIAGIDTIYYSVTNSCGTAYTNATVTVNPLPNSGAITGSTSICVTGTITLADLASGGTWSASNTHATASGPNIHGNTVGIDTITYTVTNSCGTAQTTKIVTVYTAPVLSSITGSNSVCTGTAVTLSDGVSGGTWTGSNTHATIWTSGAVSGLTAGSVIVTYSKTNGCGSDTVTFPITVNPTPNAGTISGASGLCVGHSTTLTDATTVGTTFSWSSNNASVATVTSGGVVSGIAHGIDTIIYSVTNVCGTRTATKAVVVDVLPDAGVITGGSTVCTGFTDTLSESVTGGAWSSSNAAQATVANGIVTGVSNGTVTISYTVSKACSTAVATKSITVGTLAVTAITGGFTSICPHATVALSDATTGGVWSVTNNNATISTGGILTGEMGGKDTVRYTVSGSCGSVYATKIITVNPKPDAGTIGYSIDVICIGLSTIMTDVVTGGTWLSTGTTAVVDTIGAITFCAVQGLSYGADTILYFVANAWCSDTAILPIFVDSLPAAPAAITGGLDSICKGENITLSDATSGGLWSSLDEGIAFINSAGVVTGISSGTTSLFYTNSNSCGSNYAFVQTKVLAPDSIAGGASVCMGAYVILTDATTGGTWASSNIAVATVSGGSVTGISLGAATISYSVLYTCGLVAATKTVTVDPVLTTAGTITVPPFVCEDSQYTVTESLSGGHWSSSSASIAQIDSITGVVRGLNHGVSDSNAIIHYRVANSCNYMDTTATLTVRVRPFIYGITGATAICLGSITTLADASTGGFWQSYNTSIATVTSVGGIVTGISTGYAPILYFDSNVCGTNHVAMAIHIDDATAGEIYAADSDYFRACIGDQTVFWNTNGTGTWSISAPTIANLSVLSPTMCKITALSTGIAIISYTASNSCGGPFTSTKVLTVNPSQPPIFPAISAICIGNTVTLTEDTSGIWSSSNAAIASLSPTSGDSTVLTPLSVGVAVIKFRGPYCTRLETIAVQPNSLDTIIGPNLICATDTFYFADSTNGGAWNISNTHATIDSTGKLVALSAGTDTISYTTNNTCGVLAVKKQVTIQSALVIGTITGNSQLCIPSSYPYTETATGGTWSVANAHATIDATGLVHAVSAGIDTIFYAVSNACDTKYATFVITVNHLPFAGIISGDTDLCLHDTISLTNIVTNGVWHSSNGNASIGATSGILITNVPGLDTVTYIVSNFCGVATSRPHHLFIFPKIHAGAIICADTFVCQGGFTVQTDSIIGTMGTTTSISSWLSTNTSVATVSAGVVTGVSVGLDTIKYIVANSCNRDTAWRTIAVKPLPHAGTITGLDSLCLSSTITLSDLVSGGGWVASNSNAFVSAAGVVFGFSAGKDTIKYGVQNVCGVDTVRKTLEVLPPTNPGTIIGSDSLCIGQIITLGDSIIGGVWTGTNSRANVVGNTVKGLSQGIDTVVYTVSGYCPSATTTKVVWIGAPPIVSAISGATSLCANGNSITLSDAVSGGQWKATKPTETIFTAIDSNSKLVTVLVRGLDTVSYKINNNCGIDSAIKVIEVDSFPLAGTITGNSHLCVSKLDTFYIAGATITGTYLQTNGSLANLTGNVVTGFSGGKDTIMYVVHNTCGDDTARFQLTVETPQNPNIWGIQYVCIGSTDTIYCQTFGGVWSISNGSLANLMVVTPDAVLTGIASGIDTVTYKITNACGSYDSTFILPVVDKRGCDSLSEVSSVYSLNKGMKVYPNPSRGSFTVELPDANEDITILVLDLFDKVIAKAEITNRTSVKTTFDLNVASGIYFVKVMAGDRFYREKVVIW